MEPGGVRYHGHFGRLTGTARLEFWWHGLTCNGQSRALDRLFCSDDDYASDKAPSWTTGIGCGALASKGTRRARGGRPAAAVTCGMSRKLGFTHEKALDIAFLAHRGRALDLTAFPAEARPCYKGSTSPRTSRPKAGSARFDALIDRLWPICDISLSAAHALPTAIQVRGVPLPNGRPE